MVLVFECFILGAHTGSAGSKGSARFPLRRKVPSVSEESSNFDPGAGTLDQDGFSVGKAPVEHGGGDGADILSGN
jgi:hypothetical protein